MNNTVSQGEQGKANGLSRRTSAKLAAVAVAGMATGGGLTAMITRLSKQTAPKPYRFFTEAEAALLIPICEQIIPRDDAPGATDAGVIYYIDRQLVGPLWRSQQAYRAGLESFRKTCLQVYSTPFEKLEAKQQEAALKLVDSGKAPKALWTDPSASNFLKLVVSHTMQGFYGNPRHGGNRNFLSYKMLGVPYPQVIGQNRPGRKSA